MAEKKGFRAAVAIPLMLICFLIGVAAGFIGAAYLTYNESSDVFTDGDVQIHFLELGNKYAGDCIYIKAGDNDILIDAGSRTGSVPTIKNYVDQYCEDGVLEYVIVTHAHQDHYAGFATSENEDSIFDLYETEVIIDFSMTNQKSTSYMYSNYIRERQDEIDAGAVHYTAAQCIESGKSVFELGDGISMTILDSYYYYNESDTENDYSVCCLITHGDRNFLFTGDLEEDGEERLVEMNDLPEVDLYKAGHHGSKTSSSQALLQVIKPDYVAVTCCAGSSEYTDTAANQFPTQQFIDYIAPYTDKVYVTTLCVDYDSGEYTSMNGNIVFISGTTLEVACSANNTLLKDTDWFAEARICPDAWK